MKNHEKDVEMRRLVNEALTASNNADWDKAFTLASAAVDKYFWDPDFNEEDLDVVDALLNFYKIRQNIPLTLNALSRKRALLNQPPLRFGKRDLPDTHGRTGFTKVMPPTQFEANYYCEEWYDQDFLVHIDGIREYTNHVCKMTWLASQPYIRSFRAAIDVGCREGIYSRYLHKHFDHTHSFDARKLEHFSYNVDLSKVTHFTCALGDENTEIHMSGGTHQQVEGRMWKTPCFRLDEFEFKNVDYIKIDVEGFEEKVIRGGMRTIEASWPLIVIEQNEVCLPGDDQYAAKKFLEKLGYEHVASDPLGVDLIMQKA